MIYVATCLNCGYVAYTVRTLNACSSCGQIMLTETAAERGKRIGITKKDINSFNKVDPLLAHQNIERR